MSQPRCFFGRECADLNNGAVHFYGELTLCMVWGVLDKISTSGFSCRRPFKCTWCCKTFAYALALPCQIVHDLNQSSWHVLCICNQELLTSNMLSPCKFGFQNGPDLAFVRSPIRSSTVTSHYATSHVSLGLVSACISTVLTVQFTKFLPGVGSSQLACKPLTPQQRGRGLMSSATGPSTAILEKYDLSYS
jgi:hypothetical protein